MQGGWVAKWGLRLGGIGLYSVVNIRKYENIDEDCRANKGNEMGRTRGSQKRSEISGRLQLRSAESQY